MNKFFNKDLNLELTLLSGQTFAWNYTDNWFYGSFRDKILKIKKIDDEIIWQTYPEKDNFEFIQEYFHLDLNYQKIIEEISSDLHVSKGIEKYPGLTILNQDYQQTLFSFLLAQNKNIKAIRKSLNQMKEDNNNFVKIDGQKHYFFPDLDFFEVNSEYDLLKFGVGYRAKYLKSAASLFEKLVFTEDEYQTREEIKKIKGVGDKVADCVLSFSLGFHEITPIDVWGDKVLRKYYRNTRSKTYDQKRNYFRRKFKDKTAWAGQFLFELIRGFEAENYK